MPAALAAKIRERRLVTALLGQRKHRRRPMPKQQQPNAIRLAYATALLEIPRYAKQLVDELVVPELPDLVRAAGVVHDAISHRTYVDRLHAMLDDASKKLLARFPNEKLRQLAQSMGERTSDHQREQLNRQLAAVAGRDINIDVFAERGVRERIEVFAARNVRLVKNVPQTFFDDVGSRLVQGLQDGQRAEQLQQVIEQRYGVSESRARLIARDQVGKLNGELNRTRQQALGVDSFTWRTVGDERVRDEHEELDGESFQWSAPPSEGIPGQPVNCRCTAEPNVQDEIDKMSGSSDDGQAIPLEESDEAREQREARGNVLGLVDAAQLKEAFQDTTGEVLEWSPGKSAATRKFETLTAAPQINPLPDGEDDIDIIDGRHRVAEAARRGGTIAVQFNPKDRKALQAVLTSLKKLRS